MADVTHSHFFMQDQPIGADIPDFDMGNDLLKELKAGRITLQRASEIIGCWAKEGRIALAREAASRFD